jgi:hypothetical protein
VLEIGAEQANDVLNLSRHFFPGMAVEIHKDYASLDRVVLIEVDDAPATLTETFTTKSDYD